MVSERFALCNLVRLGEESGHLTLQDVRLCKPGMELQEFMVLWSRYTVSQMCMTHRSVGCITEDRVDFITHTKCVAFKRILWTDTI